MILHLVLKGRTSSVFNYRHKYIIIQETILLSDAYNWGCIVNQLGYNQSETTKENRMYYIAMVMLNISELGKSRVRRPGLCVEYIVSQTPPNRFSHSTFSLALQLAYNILDCSFPWSANVVIPYDYVTWVISYTYMGYLRVLAALVL